MIYALILLQILDIATTHYALRTGIGTEANPVLRKLFDRFGHEPVLLAVKGAFVALLWFTRGYHLAPVLWGLCLFYAWVVWNNVKLIRQNR